MREEVPAYIYCTYPCYPRIALLDPSRMRDWSRRNRKPSFAVEKESFQGIQQMEEPLTVSNTARPAECESELEFACRMPTYSHAAFRSAGCFAWIKFSRFHQ